MELKPKTLRQTRVLYSKLIAELILWIFDQGYEVAIGQDGLGHMKGSLHYVGLAHDLLLYKDGVYLTKTEDYTFAGEKWRGMHELCRWGGDFSSKDGNHFSFFYGGRS